MPLKIYSVLDLVVNFEWVKPETQFEYQDWIRISEGYYAWTN